MERYACIFGTNNASRSGFVREVIQGEENAVFRLHVPMLAYEGNYAIPSRSPYLVGLITKVHTQIGEPECFLLWNEYTSYSHGRRIYLLGTEAPTNRCHLLYPQRKAQLVDAIYWDMQS